MSPDFPTFLSLCGSLRIPLVTDVIADLDTPLSAYWKLCHSEPQSCLLESITGGEQIGRYSVIGVRPMDVLHSRGQSDGLETVESRLKRLDFLRRPGLPKFIGGAIGMISYDYVRFIEDLVDDNADDLDLPDIYMMLFETLVVFDHARNRVRIIVLAEPNEEGYRNGAAETERLRALLQSPLPPMPEVGTCNERAFHISAEDSEFAGSVQKVIDYIVAGDCIQVVLSRRWSKSTEAHPVSIYRALRSLNPSPYMFLLRFGDLDIIGASPELLVSLSDGEARLRPIAGTRKRGTTEEEDASLEKELLADEKEVAEHLMLVDLGRNDLAKVSETASVQVNELMVVERYSHVMHIVSDVRSRVKPGTSLADVVRAVFPAGTLSGAPKVRAMQIIEECESLRRGLYGGAVGVLEPNGGIDLAIAIRSILLKDGKAHVQAGAGIVYDSDPQRECDETRQKASAPMEALLMAEEGRLV